MSPLEAPGRRPFTRRTERAAPAIRSVVRRDVEGNDLGRVELEPSVFGIEPNVAVLHQVVTAQLAGARSGTASTKTRAEVRGGGAKPFRQKGTGRARQGSNRSPNWSGGGIALGPKPRSYRQRTPKKMVRLALCSALSDRAAENRVALVDRWNWELPRTKNAQKALELLGLIGRVLVVLEPDDVVAARSFGNLPHIETVVTGELSAYDVLASDWVVFTDLTLPGATGSEEEGPDQANPDGDAVRTSKRAEPTKASTSVDASESEATEAETHKSVEATEATEAEASTSVDASESTESEGGAADA